MNQEARDVAFAAYAEQRAVVDNQIGRVRTTDPGKNELSKEVAILDALSRREASVTELTATVAVVERMKEASGTLLDASSSLTARLDTLTNEIRLFTEKADQGTNRLATWTMVLAFGTLLLVGATAGLVYVEWKKEQPHPVPAISNQLPTTTPAPVAK